MYKKGIKRIIDFILSLCGLIVLSPVFLILCVWIKLDSKGPILFKQKRVGINKTYFNIYKFRTMYIDTPKDMPTHMLANPDQYITKAGHFLRKTSLDELPQILNVFWGDMSLIGPRPNLPTVPYDELDEAHKHRLEVRPGITGYNQAYFRNSVSAEQRTKNDIYYVDNLSFFLDVKILVQTVITVLRRDNIYSSAKK